MPPPRTPHEESSDTRIPPPRIRHFERMREIFFVRGKAKDARTAESGKHHAPCESEERCFMQTDSRMKQKMTDEKDPSTALGMTIHENGSISHSLSFLHVEGCPCGAVYLPPSARPFFKGLLHWHAKAQRPSATHFPMGKSTK